MVGFVGARARKRRRNRYLFIIFILAIFGIFFYLPSIDFTTEEKQPLDEIIPSNVVDDSSLRNEIEELKLEVFQKNQRLKFRDDQIKNLREEINNLNKSSKYYKRKNKIINLFSTNQEISKKNVEIKTLSSFMDNFILKNQVILKIDTEGHEYQVIKGLEGKIKNIKYILVEFHNDEIYISYDPAKLHNYLIKNNFLILKIQI